MTDVNEVLLTAAKLREQIQGELDGGLPLHDHVGRIPGQYQHTMSFVESVLQDTDEYATFSETELGTELLETFGSQQASNALEGGNGELLSYLVGVTEQDLDASALRLPMLLLDELENNGAPAFPVAAGNPNTGKTNTMLLLAELRKADLDELLVVSNFDSSLTDYRVTSSHELVVKLLEHRETPKFVIIDEGSTHFDARTNRREIATQWTPLAKRFAKIGVDAAGIVVHTGKDLHPEAKRLATLPFFKTEKKTAEFFEQWPAESDHPAGRLFSGSLENIEQTGVDYDPNDAAPWSWNLDSELFKRDLNWREMLQEVY
jgi:hypothetical protein